MGGGDFVYHNWGDCESFYCLLSYPLRSQNRRISIKLEDNFFLSTLLDRKTKLFSDSLCEKCHPCYFVNLHSL